MEFVILFLMGCFNYVLLHFAKALDWSRILLLDNSGEEATKPVEIPKELQPAVDHIVEARLSRERAAKADYDELKKFKEETLKQNDAKAQKELEEQRKYDEAKKGYEGQINQHKEIISKKDAEINDLRIGHRLTNEISAQGGYIEETTALLKSSAILVDGNVFIKTKDANGIDVQLPVGEGVKRFLEARPHLVKSNFKAGGGGQGNAGAAAAGGQVESLTELNQKLSDAMMRRDMKAQKEIRAKITAALQAQGSTNRL